MGNINALSSLYGNEWQIQDSTQTAVVPPGWRKIALTLGNNSSVHDYHFYLRHSDGTWSHKAGVTSVTNESKDSHVVITDSNIATTITEGGYSQGVKYFLIKKPPIMDYLHHSWENNMNNPSQAEFWDCAGDTVTTSKTISGTVSHARMDYAGDVDYYAYTPSSDGTYTITMNKYTYSSGSVDYDMDIYDTYGNTIATNHSGNNPVISIYMEANHRYFIKVYDYYNLITDYKLLITH